MNRIRLAVALALGWAASASADDWGEVAQISTTLGVQANRLCLGEASRGDIGCPTYTPYVTSGGLVGIGTNSPTALLSVNAGADPAPAINTGTALLHLSGATGDNARIVLDTFGGGATAAGNVVYRTSRGTAAAPSASQAGDVMGQFSWWGYGATGYSSARAAIRATAANAWSDTEQGTLLSFFVTDPSSTSNYPVMSMSSPGTLIVRWADGPKIQSPYTHTRPASTTLHVSGTIRMSDSGEACDTNRAGAVRWHAGAGQFQVCYGSGGWALLSSAATSGSTVDRIVSGSAVQAIANNSELGGYISLTAGPAGNVWGYLGSSATYLPTVNAASITITGNLNVPGKANGTAYGTWTGWSAASPASVTTLLSTLGTQEGALYLSPALRNTVFALRENGSDDGFFFISGGGNYNSDENYDTNILALRADGRVGIGTSSPSTTLHVSGTARIANGGEACDADRAGAMRWHAGAGQFQVCYGSGGWALLSSAATSGSTVDRIVSGTSSVIASQDRSVTISTAGTARVTIGEIGYTQISAALTSSTSWAASLAVDGLATDTGNPWTTTNLARISFLNSGTVRAFIQSGRDTGGVNDGYLAFLTRLDSAVPREWMRITREGRVGISTTTPSQTLTVNGNTWVSGTVKVAGTGAESCTMGTLGQIRLNPTSGKFEVCRQ